MRLQTSEVSKFTVTGAQNPPKTHRITIFLDLPSQNPRNYLGTGIQWTAAAYSTSLGSTWPPTYSSLSHKIKNFLISLFSHWIPLHYAIDSRFLQIFPNSKCDGRQNSKFSRIFTSNVSRSTEFSSSTHNNSEIFTSKRFSAIFVSLCTQNNGMDSIERADGTEKRTKWKFEKFVVGSPFIKSERS